MTTLDLAATFIVLAGGTVPSEMNSTSLLPVLKEPKALPPPIYFSWPRRAEVLDRARPECVPDLILCRIYYDAHEFLSFFSDILSSVPSIPRGSSLSTPGWFLVMCGMGRLIEKKEEI